MPYPAEVFTSSIVAVGDFNPAIFSPDWMEHNGLIGEEDAKSVRDVEEGRPMLVSHQATNFETKWFSLQVLANQFALTSKDALSPALKDLAVGIFQLVPHTPITAIGLNFLAHYKLPNEEEYHRLGDTLAPKAIWQRLYPDYITGLADVTVRIQQGVRGEPLKSKDEKRIALQPSAMFRFGAFLSYNDHHDVGVNDSDNLMSAERVAILIDKEWESSWKDALRVFDAVLTEALRVAI